MFKSKATDHAVPQNSSGTQKKIRSVMRVKTLDESLHCSLHKQPLQKTKPLSLSVSFDKIHIREHAMILGDNPCVSQGPPVSIDWEAQEEFVYNIFEYEEVRGSARKTFQMVIPRAAREALLKKAGYSRWDFAQVIRQVNRTKNQRKKTMMSISAFHCVNRGKWWHGFHHRAQQNAAKYVRVLCLWFSFFIYGFHQNNKMKG